MSATRRYSTINQRRLQYANQATFRSKNLDDGQLVGEQLFKGPYWPRNIGLETEKTLMFCHIKMSDYSGLGLASLKSKARLMKTAAEKYDVKIHYNFLDRNAKTFYFLAEGDNYQAVESLFIHFQDSPGSNLNVFSISPVVNAEEMKGEIDDSLNKNQRDVAD